MSIALQHLEAIVSGAIIYDDALEIAEVWPSILSGKKRAWL